MQISLKQNEIEVALKNYVSQQGISLYARDVSITFTAGRKESGISAEITIEDADIPGFSDSFLMEPVIPAHLLKSEAKTLELVPAIAGNGLVDLVAAAEEAAVAATAIPAPAVVAEPGAEAVFEAPAEPAKPVSLFG